MLKPAFAIFALALLLPQPTEAQQVATPQPRRWTNVDWYQVVKLKFKAGKRDEAVRILDTYFAPATAAAGTPAPAMTLEHQTGPWDMTMIWAMPDGPSELTWEIHPNSIKWFGALVQTAGGADKAQEVLAQWEDLLANTRTEVALERRQ